jgi:hypothetical protein
MKTGQTTVTGAGNRTATSKEFIPGSNAKDPSPKKSNTAMGNPDTYVSAAQGMECQRLMMPAVAPSLHPNDDAADIRVGLAESSEDNLISFD